MSIYQFVLFFHILAMLGLTIAVAFQWTMLRNAASAHEGEQALRWIRATARLPLLVFPSLATVLGTGLYMAARISTFGSGWISASLLSILLIAAVSIMAGPATRALHRSAKLGKEDEVRRTLLRPLLVTSVRLQFALLLTITFLMVVRTSLAVSLQIVGIGAAFGLLWSVSTWRTGRF
jgi:uncharacterized membrane protein